MWYLIEHLTLYLTGIVLALLGKYPYKELEHLDYLKTQIVVDHQWLSITKYKPLSQRHYEMIKPDFRSRELEPIQSIRERISEPMKKRDPDDKW